jgi:hypothetical protein
MTRSRIGIATAAAVAALALGTGTAWAHARGHQDGGHHAASALARSGGPIEVVTGYLGITAGQLRADLAAGRTLAQIADATPGKSAAGLVQALTAAAKSRLDAAVASGKLSSAQERLVLGKLTPAIGAVVNGASAKRMSPVVPGVKEALAYLGLTPAQVIAGLVSGKTLGQIADATPGESAAGLVQTLTAAAKAELDTAVATGVITPARERALLTRVTKLVRAVVDGHLHLPRAGSHR